MLSEVRGERRRAGVLRTDSFDGGILGRELPGHGHGCRCLAATQSGVCRFGFCETCELLIQSYQETWCNRRKHRGW